MTSDLFQADRRSFVLPLYYPLIKPFKSFRQKRRHAALLPLTIYFHYALRKAPCLTTFLLGNLMKLFISERIVYDRSPYRDPPL